jgi:hypothetical protein
VTYQRLRQLCKSLYRSTEPFLWLTVEEWFVKYPDGVHHKVRNSLRSIRMMSLHTAEVVQAFIDAGQESELATLITNQQPPTLPQCVVPVLLWHAFQTSSSRLVRYLSAFDCVRPLLSDYYESAFLSKSTEMLFELFRAGMDPNSLCHGSRVPLVSEKPMGELSIEALRMRVRAGAKIEISDLKNSINNSQYDALGVLLEWIRVQIPLADLLPLTLRPRALGMFLRHGRLTPSDFLAALASAGKLSDLSVRHLSMIRAGGHRFGGLGRLVPALVRGCRLNPLCYLVRYFCDSSIQNRIGRHLIRRTVLAGRVSRLIRIIDKRLFRIDSLRDRRGRNPLHYVAMRREFGSNDPFLIKALMNSAVDIDAQMYRNGRTPVCLAAVCGNHRLVGSLLEKGASPVKGGPMEISKKLKFKKISNLLKKFGAIDPSPPGAGNRIRKIIF